MRPEIPVHPGHEEQVCGCHQVWAKAMRSGLPLNHLPTPPQRLTVALLKPGAPRAAIRSRLRGLLEEVHTVERELSASDCDLLYPDAYGASFVAQRTEYLTAGSILVVALAGGPDAVACGVSLKQTIRADLGTDVLHNHLHMPDNPAEALADIALLAGWDVLHDLYQRWEGRDDRLLATRLEGYRAHLVRWAGSAGVVGARRPPIPVEQVAGQG